MWSKLTPGILALTMVVVQAQVRRYVTMMDSTSKMKTAYNNDENLRTEKIRNGFFFLSFLVVVGFLVENSISWWAQVYFFF